MLTKTAEHHVLQVCQVERLVLGNKKGARLHAAQSAKAYREVANAGRKAGDALNSRTVSAECGCRCLCEKKLARSLSLLVSFLRLPHTLHPVELRTQ